MNPCPLITTPAPRQGGGGTLGGLRPVVDTMPTLQPATIPQQRLALPPGHLHTCTPPIVVVYIVVPSNPLMVSHASHFIGTYLSNPGGVQHRLVIAVNGGPLPRKLLPIFAEVPCAMLERFNDGGWDISAYIDAANRYESHLQVCLGESVYFHRPGWLRRIAESADQNGPGIYGCFSSNFPRAHLNTTAFAATTEYLRQMPWPADKAGRYAFEHGETAFWRRVARSGGAACLVTWDGCWQPQDWRRPDNILWRGNQSNCLLYSNHTDKFSGATEASRQAWIHNADLPFR